MRVFIIFVAIFSLATQLVIAQEANADIKSCTLNEVQSITKLLDTNQFLDEFLYTSTLISEANDSDGIIFILNHLDTLSETWFDVISPDLPKCALAVNINAVIGRVVDEQFIAMSLMQNLFLSSELKQQSNVSFYVTLIEKRTDNIGQLSETLFEIAAQLGD